MTAGEARFTTREAERLRGLYEAVQLFRKPDAEMTSQAISVLIDIAMRPGITMLELADRVGLSNTATSRNIRKFLDKGGGLGLIRQEEDADDARKKPLYLTAAGESLISGVLRSI
ncbi:MAG TPA: winged helix-turn-helix transcriptional regulator [Tepidisphaeraceae bacterium]|nr:winged helix-turn-helix transcriptional regulator [Tepidisphaeraceae bacterium]